MNVIDDETFCGVTSLAVSDIASSNTFLQCENLSEELLAAMCPTQDYLCSAEADLGEFCPTDCQFECVSFLTGCCPQVSCCTGSDLSEELVCGVYEGFTGFCGPQLDGRTESISNLEREFCPCKGTSAATYCADVAPDCVSACTNFADSCCDLE